MVWLTVAGEVPRSTEIAGFCSEVLSFMLRTPLRLNAQRQQSLGFVAQTLVEES